VLALTANPAERELPAPRPSAQNSMTGLSSIVIRPRSIPGQVLEISTASS
jgi:hypothetical protein